MLEAAQRGRGEPEPAPDADGEIDDREGVPRGRGILHLERAHERLDRREQLGLGELGRAERVQRERGLGRDVLERRDLVHPERLPVQADDADAAERRVVERDRDGREQRAGRVGDVVERVLGRAAFHDHDLRRRPARARRARRSGGGLRTSASSTPITYTSSLRLLVEPLPDREAIGADARRRVLADGAAHLLERCRSARSRPRATPGRRPARRPGRRAGRSTARAPRRAPRPRRAAGRRGRTARPRPRPARAPRAAVCRAAPTIADEGVDSGSSSRSRVRPSSRASAPSSRSPARPSGSSTEPASTVPEKRPPSSAQTTECAPGTHLAQAVEQLARHGVRRARGAEPHDHRLELAHLLEARAACGPSSSASGARRAARSPS